MLNFIRRSPAMPKGARGYRAYAIGDIHGRLDLLDRLLAQIEADDERRGARKTLLVFLGDLIDRGPSSAEVVERLRTYRRDGVRPVFILGNHEEVLLRVIDGDASMLASWLRFGGAETLASYGADAIDIATRDPDSAVAAVREAVPSEHVAFLRSFVDTFRFGDYLFVHAGIRPGIELHLQAQSDLRWIREPFLDDDSDHGFVVVHGHSIRRQVEQRPNRIGIDTGAFHTGVLTAVGIEGTHRWFLSTGATDRSVPDQNIDSTERAG
jgi:serine/threonine protein phosphatase 1